MIESIYLIPNHSKFVYKNNIYEIYGFLKNEDNKIYVKCYSPIDEDSKYFKLDENLLNSVNYLYNNIQNILNPEEFDMRFSLEDVNSNFLNDKYKESKLKDDILNCDLSSINLNSFKSHLQVDIDISKNKRIYGQLGYDDKFKNYLVYKSNCLIEFKININFKLKALYSEIYKEFPNGVGTIIKRNNILFHSLVTVKKVNDSFIVEYTIEKEFQNVETQSRDNIILSYIGLYLSELFNDSDKIKKELIELNEILSTL